MMATEAEDASRPGKDETQSQEEEPKAQNGSEEKFLPMFNYKKAIDRDRVLLILDEEEENLNTTKKKKKKKRKDLIADVLGKRKRSKPKAAAEKKKKAKTAEKQPDVGARKATHTKPIMAEPEKVILSILDSDSDEDSQPQIIAPPTDPKVLESMRLLRQSQEMLNEIQAQLVSPVEGLRSSGGDLQTPEQPPSSPTTSSVILGIKCPLTKQILRFKVLKNQTFQQMATTYLQRTAKELEKYYMDNRIPKDDQKVVLKFDGIPLDIDNNTPQDFAMADNDIIMVHLPAPAKRLDIQKEIAEDQDLVELAKTRPPPQPTAPGTRALTAGLPLAAQAPPPPAHTAPEKDEDDDEEQEYIMLKVRLLNSSDVDKFRIKRSDQLGKLITAYCAKKKFAAGRVQLMFDGLPIKPTQTPEQLDMDDDDLIDAEPT